jgi:aarF domain-containing kinase
MYSEFSEAFRQSYSNLWVAMVLSDVPAMRAICTEWGIADSDLFASMQLMKPFNRNRAAHIRGTTRTEMILHAKEMRERGYERTKLLLADTSKIPHELVLLGRQMNIVRANNAAMGSAANRVSIMAHLAAENSRLGRSQLWLFRMRMWLVSAAYVIVQTRRRIMRVFGSSGASFEELLQQQMAREVEGQFGVRLRLKETELWEQRSGA